MKTITKAALKYDGKIYTGFNHGKCFVKLDKDNHIILSSRIEEGFITSEGDFVDRKEAMKIANEADQLQYSIAHYKETLISEDLHIDWLIKQENEIRKLKSKLSKSNRDRKRLKRKLDILHTDYCLIQDALENSHEWIDHLKNELKNEG